MISYLSSAIDRFDIWVAIAVVILYTLIILAMRKAPSTSVLKDFISVLNTRGGQILLLFVAGMIFFSITVLTVMIILNDIKSGTLREDNSIALLAIQFCSNTAFAGTWGAMLTLLTGKDQQQVHPGVEGSSTETHTDTVTVSPASTPTVTPAP